MRGIRETAAPLVLPQTRQSGTLGSVVYREKSTGFLLGIEFSSKRGFETTKITDQQTTFIENDV